MTPPPERRQSPVLRGALLEDAAQRAARYLDSLATRPVAPPAAAVARLDVLDTSMPAAPSDAAEVLARLDDIVSPATMARRCSPGSLLNSAAGQPIAMASAAVVQRNAGLRHDSGAMRCGIGARMGAL